MTPDEALARLNQPLTGDGNRVSLATGGPIGLPEGEDTRETAQRDSAPRDPEPNRAQCEAISRWLYDESDTRTVGELRTYLRSLGDGVHPRSVDPR